MTDFDRFGLRGADVALAGRSLLVTFDFEEFRADTIDAWTEAMHAWAAGARRLGAGGEFFISLEDVALLRRDDASAYERFLAALRVLAAAGSALHAHNHCAFDPDSAERAGAASGYPQQIAGYRKRASMYYDVVRRCGLDWAGWAATLASEHARLLEDAGIAAPRLAAFRAGGWDCGSSAGEQRAYLEGLRSAGFVIDSSATSGEFGTASWRVEAPFGASSFEVAVAADANPAWGRDRRLLELAPSWSVQVPARALSRASAASARSLARQGLRLVRARSGALVAVIHFHEFVAAPGELSAADRVALILRALSAVTSILRLEVTSFDRLLAGR